MIGDDYQAIRALRAWERRHAVPFLPPAKRLGRAALAEPWPRGGPLLAELWPGGPSLSRGQMCLWAWPLDDSALGRFARDLAEFLRAYAENALIDLGVTMAEWKRKAERLQPPPPLTGRWRPADPDERAE